MRETIRQLFEHHEGKVSEKWHLYLGELERLFAPYREERIRLMEIGIENGGSLEIWGKYFSNAERIVGCDINPKCEQLTYDDPRISIIVGDVNSDDCESRILQKGQTFDIIMDDGSHHSSDTVRSFTRYFPYLRDNGLYIIEDLHASYWEDFEGGLHNPLSAMAFLKRLCDILNYEHWRLDKKRKDMLIRFEKEYMVKFDDFDLAKIHSIEFLNSLCIIKKMSSDENLLGARIVVGTNENIAGGLIKLRGTIIHDLVATSGDDENLDVFELIRRTDEQEQAIQKLKESGAKQEETARVLTEQINERDKEILTFSLSTSWKITRPFRKLRKLLGGK